MARITNPDTLGRQRTKLMRTSAEMLRHLSQKQAIDDDAKDMLALLAMSLQEIADGIVESTIAWEKRNYWMKIEQFERKWGWTHRMAVELRVLILNEKWHELPQMMVKLFPQFADIKVQKLTRKPEDWLGCYEQLLHETEPS